MKTFYTTKGRANYCRRSCALARLIRMVLKAAPAIKAETARQLTNTAFPPRMSRLFDNCDNYLVMCEVYCPKAKKAPTFAAPAIVASTVASAKSGLPDRRCLTSTRR